jgi:putrescine transport system permease protein
MLRVFTAIPYAWLFVLFLVPFGIVLKISVSDYAVSIPPYTPTFDLAAGWDEVVAFVAALDFENFVFLTEDDLYWKAYLSSVQIAAVSTGLALVAGFPIAYAMSRASDVWRPALMMLVILPFWTSFLIRVYAWIGILANEGFLNQFLIWSGVISEPLQLLNTPVAVYIGIVYTYLPFMILPVYASLDRMDPALLEAAEDLGCSRLSAFWHVTWPLARPGVVAGSFLVFIPAVGEFVIPSLLGGSGTLMIGKVLWEEFFSNRDWPVASAVAIILLLILIVPIVLFQRHQARERAA